MASNEAVTTIKVNYDGKEAERGLKGLKTAVSSVISIAVVKKMYDLTMSLAKMGAEGLRAERAFGKFVPSVTAATEKLRKASLGLVEDTVLQQKAIKALIAGIDIDSYAAALEYASKYAIATGQETEQVLDKILNSFLTGRAQGLKKVGITVNSGKNMVTDAVSQMSKKMQELDVDMNDPILQTDRMNASIQNLKDTIGRDMIPVANKLTNVFLKIWEKASKQVRETIEGYQILDAISKGASDRAAVFQVEFKNAQQLAGKEERLSELEKMRTRNATQFATALDSVRKLEAGIEEFKSQGKMKDAVRLEKELTDTKKDMVALLNEEKSLSAEIAKTEKLKDPTKITPGLTEEQIKKQVEMEKQALQTTHQGRLKAIEEERRFMIAEYGFTAKDIANINKIQNQKITEENKAHRARESKAIEDQYEMEKVTNYEELNVHFLTNQERIQSEMETDLEIKRLMEDRTLTSIELIDAELEAQKQANREKYWNGKQTAEQMAAMELELTEMAQQKKLDIYMETANRMIANAGNLNSALSALSDAQTQKEIKNLDVKKMGQRRYDKAVAKIQKEGEDRQRTFARIEQALLLGQTVMNVAKAIMKSHATLPPPFNWIEAGLVAATGAVQIATIQAQKFQRGFLGDESRGRMPDDISATIGRNEAVIPGPQYAMHREDVQAIVNNTANTAAGMRALRGGSVVHNYYGLSSEQVITVQRDAERRKYTGRLL